MLWGLERTHINMNEQERFKKSIAFVFKWEGGLVNNPDDPGGLTNFGISKTAYPKMSNKEIKELTREKAESIYYRDYWTKSGAILAQWPACLAILDTAINMGVSRALRFLGESGQEDPTPLAKDIIASREAYYVNLATKRPKFKQFLKGWLNRINDLKRCGEIE